MKRNLICLALVVVAASSQAAMLWDNGPFQTGTGNGAGGANTSAIQAPFNNFGYNNNFAGPFALADDFTLASASTLSSLTVYSYQTGSTTTSTFTAGAWAIYSSAPTTATSTAVAGNLGATGAISASYTGIFRVTATTLTDANRPIMAVTMDLGNVELGAGSYYVAWALSGSLASGPWGVPITPARANDNALQLATGVFGLIDGDTVTAGVQTQDMAFNIQGSVVPEPATLTALGLGAVALLRRRKKA